MNTRIGATNFHSERATLNSTIARVTAMLALLTLLPATSFAATLIEVDVAGRVFAEGGNLDDHGYGAFGLFAGLDLNDEGIGKKAKASNWEWNTVLLKICDDGDANISGTMKRRSDDSVWGVNIALSTLHLVGPAFSGTTLNSNSLHQLLASEEDHAGFEWESLALTFTPPGGYAETTPPLTGWTGLAMPDMGHVNVAELHYDAGVGLTFEAWYQHAPEEELLSSKTSRRLSRKAARRLSRRAASTADDFYRMGDTKGNIELPEDPSTDNSGVPEPSALALILAGLLGSSLMRNRRRRNR